jgi:type II secretion system protein G
MKRNEKGFTLIELLIVVIILGILAVIGIPKFMNSKQEAIVKACQTNRSSLEDAGERYFYDIGVYPGKDFAAADAGADGSAAQKDLYAATSETNNWNGPYTKAAFTCPYDGVEEYWFNKTSGTVTCIKATGGVVKKSGLVGIKDGHALRITD